MFTGFGGFKESKGDGCLGLAHGGSDSIAARRFGSGGNSGWRCPVMIFIGKKVPARRLQHHKKKEDGFELVFIENTGMKKGGEKELTSVGASMSKSPPNMELKSPKRSSICPERVMAPSLWK